MTLFGSRLATALPSSRVFPKSSKKFTRKDPKFCEKSIKRR